MGAGERREQEPVFIAEASQSHRLELLVIYKLTTPGPRAAPASPASAIIVWPRPGHLLRASRSAITSQSPARRCPQRPPSQPAFPNAHPPSPLCMRQHGRLPGCRRGRKTQESEPRAARVPAPNHWARKPRGPPKTGPGQQKAHAYLPPSSAHHRVPVFPSRFHRIPVHPALFSIPLLSLRLRAKARSFFWGTGGRLQKALYGGWREIQGESISPSPHPAPGVQLLESRIAARSRENNIRASTMHIQSGIHLLTPRRPALQHLALTIKGYSGSGALPKTTLMHSRSYFNALETIWLTIL